LFLMSGRDEVAGSLVDRATWAARKAQGVVVPLLTAQHWFRLRAAAKDKTPITIVAVTSLGGDFGLSHKVAVADGGALAGMLKSIYIEDSRLTPREVRVKVIDAPADEPPAAVVEAIWRELAAADPQVEVGWSRGRRCVLRSQSRAVESLSRRGVARGGNWVVTGGARGITGACAFELAKRYGLTLHLIGRSPAPRADAPWRGCTPEQLSQFKSQVVRQAISEGRSPERDWERIKSDIEIHGTLAKCASAGIRATYYSCDLADWDHLASILAEIRRQAPIDGVIHGAGYGKHARFATRTVELMERTMNGKLDGAVALMSLLRQDPLRHFIAFGSIAGRYGGNGLADYAAANDMLAKLCAWYRAERPDCAVACLDWQSWDQIGGAMLPDSAAGTKGVLKMAFIPPIEGVEHVARELEAGLPAAEVLFTDRFFERTFYPFIDSAEPPVAASDAGHASGGAAAPRFPLVDKVEPMGAGGHQAEIRFEPASDPFLRDHQLRGKPLLPEVIGLEAMAETARLTGGKPVVAIRDVQLIEGLVFHTERPLVARVRATGEDNGTIACELLSDFRNRADKLIKKDRRHISARVEVGERVPLDIPRPQPPTAWHPFEYPASGPLYHGPTLHALQAISLDAGGGWGQVTALSLAQLGRGRAGRDWIVPATLVDAGFYICGVHAWFHASQAFSLPAATELVRLGRMPRENESCLLAFTCRQIEPRQAIYDFTVWGDDGATIVRVEGHQIAMIRS
jgi:NAD(P)-dependent dehydrogenase (short-subunit alcohol dehydrogenase family)